MHSNKKITDISDLPFAVTELYLYSYCNLDEGKKKKCFHREEGIVVYIFS